MEDSNKVTTESTEDTECTEKIKVREDCEDKGKDEGEKKN